MTYWEASEPPEALYDWVDQNVRAAIEDFWERDVKLAWVDCDWKDGKFTGPLEVVFPGPEKPSHPFRDIYRAEFRLLSLIKDFAEPYDSIGGPCSEEQRADLRQRAEILREFARSINELAAKAEQAAK